VAPPLRGVPLAPAMVSMNKGHEPMSPMERSYTARIQAATETGKVYARSAAFVRDHPSAFIRRPIPTMALDMSANSHIFVILGVWRQALLDIETAPWFVGIESLDFVESVLGELSGSETTDVSDLACAVMQVIEKRSGEATPQQPVQAPTDTPRAQRLLLCHVCGSAYWGKKRDRKSVCLRCSKRGSAPSVSATDEVMPRPAPGCPGKRCRECDRPFVQVAAPGRKNNGKMKYCSSSCRRRGKNRDGVKNKRLRRLISQRDMYLQEIGKP
jgi:hypothetical protein